MRLEAIAAIGAQVFSELAGDIIEDAVVFYYTRILPIDYRLFVARVDIARTIQFMNDYLAALVVPLGHDQEVAVPGGTQHLPAAAELPGALPGPADRCQQARSCRVTSADRRRLYWKTIASETALPPTMMASRRSSRRLKDACTIVGRQLFTLPLFWQVSIRMVPAIKSMLVTHAYSTFLIGPWRISRRWSKVGNPHRPAGGRTAPPAMEQLIHCCSGLARS